MQCFSTNCLGSQSKLVRSLLRLISYRNLLSFNVIERLMVCCNFGERERECRVRGGKKRRGEGQGTRIDIPAFWLDVVERAEWSQMII